MKTCIDLKALFGSDYRIAYDESYAAERGDDARRHDPWLLTIPCRFGHIYPQGGSLLGASTDRRGPVANRLAALPCVRVIQDGDDGLNTLFDVTDFDEVAQVMKPRRRRRLTPDQRAERVERLRKYQFGSATHNAGGERRRDARGEVGSKHWVSHSTRS
jgi:hypothetical protein